MTQFDDVVRSGVGLLVLMCPGTALAFSESIEIPSHTLTDEMSLAGRIDGAQPVTVTGTLAGPDVDTPLPLVILMHGSDGPGSGAVYNWDRHLRGLGIATLALDSFSGRDLDNISADQNQFDQFIQLYDAFRAVETASADRRIDPSRIALMGFSRGGTAALYSALNRFRSAFGPAQGTIVAHIPFYPTCNFELEDELSVTGAPIRLFMGALDDWTSPEVCTEQIQQMSQAGADAEIVLLPDALHAFDNPRNPAYFSDEDWQTSRNCMRVEVDGQLQNPETGQLFSYSDTCVEHGPHVQFNGAATRAAQEQVAALLNEVFALEQ